METLQKLTTKELDTRQLAWIDHVATGGLSIDVDGKAINTTAIELAKRLKVARQTLYDWQETIPGFWDMVRVRRNELYSRNAMTLVYKAMLKKATGGDVAAAKLVMQQARVLEAERVDHTTNGKDIVIPILGGVSALSRDDSDPQAT